MEVAVKEMFGPLVAATPPDLQTRGTAKDHIPVSVRKLKAAPTRVYSKEEWDAQKPFIGQQYAAGTLETTRKALGDQGFPVTSKQLKRKVMDWGFRKNLKPEEKKAIVRQHELALASGNAALSLDHPLHRPITSARIDRMVNRDKIVFGLVDEPDSDAPLVIKDQVITEGNIPSTECNLQHHSEVTIRTKRVASPESNHLVLEVQSLEPEPTVNELPQNDRGLDFHEILCDITEFPELTSPNKLYTWQSSLAGDGFSSEYNFTHNDDHMADDEATVESGQRSSTLPPDLDMIEIDEVLSDPHVSGNDPQCHSEGTQSSEMLLYQPIMSPRSNNHRLPCEDATTHADNMKKLSNDLSKVLRTIGIPCEESDAPKAISSSKRKRPKTAMYYFSPDKEAGNQSSDSSKRIQLRAGFREQKMLYALGFALMRQPDESISMVLPPPFEGLYLRERELSQREMVFEMDRLHGLDDGRTINALFRLANTCNIQSRVTVAEYMYRRVVVTSRRVLGDATSRTSFALLEIANIMRRKNEIAESQKLFDHLEAHALYYHRENSSIMLNVSRRKTNLLLHLGNYAEAEARIRSFPNLIGKQSGRSQIYLLDCAIQLSRVLRKQHKNAKCKEILLDVIRKAETTQKEWATMMILECKRYIYRILRGEGAVEEAKRLKKEVHRELEILRPGIHPHEAISY